MKLGNAGGGKGPQFRVNARRGKAQETGVSLRAPESVQKLQTALHAKAKEEPTYRFYALYDKLYREDILAHAWRLAKANGGAGGVDGRALGDIEEVWRRAVVG